MAQSSASAFSDRAVLATIIGNFLGNAIKYTISGSVLLGCRRKGDHLSVQVLDSGIGIEASRIPTLFEAFQQSDEVSEGLGLGLSIAQRTAAALDHPIEAVSEIGRGSVFSVEVPIAK